MELGVSCAAWKALFVIVIFALLVGNVIGFRVWKTRRAEQPSWRPYLGFGYLFRSEYYPENAPHGVRKLAATLIALGVSVGIVLGGAVLYAVLTGGSAFCGFDL